MPSQAAADPPEIPKNKSPPAKAGGDWAKPYALLQLGKLGLLAGLLTDLVLVGTTLTIRGLHPFLDTVTLPDPFLLLPGSR